jgi:hypothetical protein
VKALGFWSQHMYAHVFTHELNLGILLVSQQLLCILLTTARDSADRLPPPGLLYLASLPSHPSLLSWPVRVTSGCM